MPSALAPSPSRVPVAGGALLAAVFLVALNLRVGIAAVPPLADTIAADLGLGAPLVGLLTALPPLCMGLFAPTGQRLAQRYGREATIALGLAAVLVGSALRGVPTVWAQYAGTLLLGTGIAVAGTVVPGVVKQAFPARPGLATGTYMFAMMAGAATAAGLVVPLTRLFGSWSAALASTAVLALVALLAWLPVVRRVNEHTAPAAAHALPYSDRTAWAVAAFLALQSTIYYTELAWIPSWYVETGWTQEAAGALLVAFTAGQLVSGLGAPALADHVGDQRRILWPLTALVVAGTAGLLLAPAPQPAPWLAWAWMLLLGLGLGGSFSMGLVLLVAYATDAAASARLSAMAFLVSYSAAALGPFAFGVLLEVVGYAPAWAGALVLGLVQAVAVRALRPGRVVGGHPPVAAGP